jgi:two-component system chemotaxis response regulator CheB
VTSAGGPDADLLLATLAVTCGPRAPAVVLAGNGTDARAGIRAIAHCDGRVIAQDQPSSPHFGMPGAAIDTTLAHDVLALPDIPPAIRVHVTNHHR